MEMDINALSRPYDPSVDDEEQGMPVQHFLQGGDVSSGGGSGGHYETVDNSQNGGSVYQVWVPDTAAGGGGSAPPATSGPPTTSGPPVTGGTVGTTYFAPPGTTVDPDQYVGQESARMGELSNYFNRGNGSRLNNNSYASSGYQSYQAGVPTLPIDPATGAPKDVRS